MESIQVHRNPTRKQKLYAWLKDVLHLSQDVELQRLAGDASFRCYYRIKLSDESLIVMDAPPATENCVAFIAIADALRGWGLHTPKILHANVSEGFLILNDFGDAILLKILNSDNANQLYPLAIHNLVRMQSMSSPAQYPLAKFDKNIMLNEWELHKEWFLTKFLNTNILQEERQLDYCFDCLQVSAANQPQVFMHRDYHSGNLILIRPNQLGILDFQDAFIGPVTYDLVSLLRDCYIDWPAEKVREWALLHKTLLEQNNYMNKLSSKEFLRWFDLMGLERHLKALITFSRKFLRDNDSRYLNFIPRTIHYLISVSRQYSEMLALHELLINKVQPLLKGRSLCAD